MTNIYEIPEIPKALLDALRDQFPVNLPSPSTTEREDLYHAGEQAVLEYLEWLIEKQQETKCV
tara:strand:- start:11689 stop:11877 length:189 start_codon:yes stop_codon:yes gene_type:complete